MKNENIVKSYHNSADKFIAILREVYRDATKSKDGRMFKGNVSEAALEVLATLQFAAVKGKSPELAAYHTLLIKKIAVVERLMETRQYRDLCSAIDEATLALSGSLQLVERVFGVAARISDFPVISKKRAA